MAKIEFTKIGCRSFDINELASTLMKNMTVWSWGAHAWTKYKDLALRFKVNGHHHKGHVYQIPADPPRSVSQPIPGPVLCGFPAQLPTWLR